MIALGPQKFEMESTKGIWHVGSRGPREGCFNIGFEAWLARSHKLDVSLLDDSKGRKYLVVVACF